MTTWVSGGICMSRSNLRLGGSEDESDALFGKGSGSPSFLKGSGGKRCGCARCRGARKFAKQAVTLEARNRDRQYLSYNVRRGEHMSGLQPSGAADDLAGIAGRAFEQ